MSFKLRQLKAQLKSGAIIAYPTETVWGLGCLPNHQTALKQLANIKQRSINKGFILVSPQIEYCLPYIDSNFHEQAIRDIAQNKIKPTTWLAPKSRQLSSLVSGQFNTVAIRISPHPFIENICQSLQSPLISTSANMHSRPSLNTDLLVQKFLGHKLDQIIHGYNNGSGLASSIVDLESKQIIRP